MKSFLFKSVLLFLFCISNVSEIKAQECNMLAPGSDAGFDQLGFCAPVTGRVKYFTFYAITEIPVSKLKVEINWGEGKKRYDVTSLGYDSNLEMYVYKMPEATHEYKEDRINPKCSYPVTVQAFVNGKLCGSPKQSGTVIVWDKDDATGANLLLDPVTYYACPGTEFSVNFTDESIWNCVPPKEKINMNWPKRTTQFVYGTNNTISGTVKIEDIPTTTFPFEGALQEYEDKKTAPVGEYRNSSKITIPASAKVGEIFEITLNNWNYCNQLPEAPIQRKAIIEIVAKPEATFTIENESGSEVSAFCPGDKVFLKGGYTVETGSVLASDVGFHWSIEEVSTGKIQNYSNQKDLILESGFLLSGLKKVKLTVSNNKTNTSTCTDFLEKTISVIDAPLVKSTINDGDQKELFFCAEDPETVSVEVDYAHTITSNENFTYAYHLFKRNSTDATPDSTLNLIQGSGIRLQENKESYKALYGKPGLYRVQITARNNTTGCITVEENKVAIYEKPNPDFTIEGLCLGQPTIFTDKSTVSTAVPGDKIIVQEWDLDYSQENSVNNTFDVDGTGENFNWTFAQPGVYNVGLKVLSKAGCDTIKTAIIEIKAVPEVDLSSNYSGNPICPGDTIRFENKSVKVEDPTLFENGITYTLFVSDSIATKEIILRENQKIIDFNSFYNPSDSVETYTIWLQAKANTPNDCAVNSQAILVKVRSGAAAGYITSPVYSPFEPNCSPKILKFDINKNTRQLEADSYKWSIILNGEIKDEIIKNKGDASFETLEYTFGNSSAKYLDYEVKLTVEKAGVCIVPSTNTFRIYPNPKPQFSVVSVLEACDSTVFEIKVTDPTGISDYIWDFSPNLPVNNEEIGVKDDNFFVAYSRPPFGAANEKVEIRLKAKNFYGCEAEWMEEISINPVIMHDPELKLIGMDGEGCRPLTVSFSNETIGNSEKISYELIVENIATGTMLKIDRGEIDGDLYNEFSYTFNESGEFNAYIQGTAEIENGTCTKMLKSPITISVAKDPVANFTVFPAEDCGILTAVIAKTSFDSEFNTWSITDKQSGALIYGPIRSKSSEDTFNQFRFENTTETTKSFKIKLTAENLAGCMAADSMVVTVFPQPKAYFNITADVCDPHVVKVDHNNADESGQVTYTWIWGDGTTSEGSHPPDHSYRNDSYDRELHYNIKLIATSAKGCVADSTIRLVVHPKVKADFDANILAGCAPLNVNFINISKGVNELYSGWYIREKGNPLFEFVSNTMLQHTFENERKTPIHFEVMYKAQNAGGCVDSLIKEITVQPEIISDFLVEPSKEVYSGTNIEFLNDKVIPGINYFWNWGDGSASQIINAEIVTYSYQNTTTKTHYYEVTLTAEDPINGCKSVSSTLITVYPRIQLELSAKKDTICLPEIPEFNLFAKNVKSHYWYSGKKGALDLTRRLDDIYDPSLFQNITSKPITYEVMYVGVTNEGFKDSVSTDVVVYPALQPSFVLDGLSRQLPNATFKITNSSSNASNWVTLWDFGNGDTSTQPNPVSYKYSTYGNYNISLTISNGFCSESFTMGVTVTDAKPEISFNMTDTEGCWPVTVTFENTSAFTDENQYFWDFGDGMGTSSAVSPSYTYNKPGNYKATLSALNRTGEENATFTAEQIIKVYPQPSPDFVVRKEIVYIPEEPVHVANYSQRGVWYRWDFGDGTIYEGADQYEPVHYYQKPGEYNIKLVVRSEHGCEDSITVLRAVIAEGGGNVTIPNAFTPNSAGGNGGHIDQGGINDVFHPVFKGIVLKYQLLIYNRWGEQVFESYDTKIGWDGYYKDRLCSSGMYLYKISATLSDGKTINEIGDLMLIQ